MKKKSLLTLLLALCMALTLLGCGGQEGEQKEAVSRVELPDGQYTVDFETDNSMFRATEAHDGKGVLTVVDGVATLHVSLNSKNIVNLYPGTKAQAKEDEAGWLQPTTDTVTYSDGLSDEVYGFDVPVPCIGEEFDLALIGKKGTWYDHKVSVQNPTPLPDAPEPVELADGTYRCDVTLTGGSGRASVESPAVVTVEGETVMATIVWSSPYYEYMLVGQVKYEPVQAEGNSTFTIPVALDCDMAVSASTVAMSQPHLVDYTLHFYSGSAEEVTP